jgi:hypothetical protein
MQVTCPCCHESFPIAAGFLEADGKRLAALLADMEPVLGRAVLAYLRLFKPAKQGLRTARAVKLVAELGVLVREGTVCRDERTSARRAATPAMWAQGIDQLLQQTDRLTLPLANHHYLRAIVYGIADQADAAAERQREADKRAGRHLAPASDGGDAASQRMARQEAIGRLLADFNLKLIDQAEFDRRAAELGFQSKDRP